MTFAPWNGLLGGTAAMGRDTTDMIIPMTSNKGGLESAGQSLAPGEIPRGRHQSLIFGSGSRMSRELFRELSSAEGPSAVSAFQAFMQTSVALEERREGVVSTMSRAARLDPVELLSVWLDAQALGHLVLLAFRLDAPWFTEMVLELRPENWTPTHAITSQRIMGVSLRGAFAVGQLHSTALDLYVGALERPAQPLEHFDAVLALASLSLQQPHLATVARLAVEEWAGRATSDYGFRKELRLSFATVLDDPGRAREWSLAWCRDVLELRGSREAQTALAMAQRCGLPEKEALLLTALGHSGDCGAIVDGLSPAVLLLSHLYARDSDELYPPAAAIEYVNDRWTPELGVDVLRRTISVAFERSPHTWS